MRLHAMRAAVLTAGCAMVLALAANGCTQQSRSEGDATGGSGGARTASSAPATTAPRAPADRFLARGECSTRNRQRVEEVPCRGERAAAKVIARHEGAHAKGPRCPARTDFVLHISESRPSADGPGESEGPGESREGTAADRETAGLVARGYACMRALEPPHPGDPGGGGGPLTVVGDCVYTTARDREVEETPCDRGPGRHAPEFRVDSRVAARALCPPGTALFVDLGGTDPVGCAHRV